MSELVKRRDYSQSILDSLSRELREAGKFAADKACVYATGSLGRREAGKHSDLDLFIVGKNEKWHSEDQAVLTPTTLLSHLDEICLQAELIQASRKLKFPEFSGDGRYLNRHSAYEFTSTLGTERDDVTNTFTARLLLLLESSPLIEAQVYTEVIKDVIDSYWRDYADHRQSFMPAFLANDILRLWRTFCVNYEARTEREPDEKKASGKLKNYKLKYSRLLTCYSALMYLLALYSLHGSVTPADAFQMTTLTPTQRLEWLHEQKDFEEAKGAIERLLCQYDSFLGNTDFSEQHLISEFMDRDRSSQRLIAAREFGDTMFEALSQIGGESPFYRLLVV